MTRTLSAQNEAMLGTRNHHRALCVRIEARQGTVLAFTNHDAPLSFVLPQTVNDYEEEYSPRAGLMASEIMLATGMDVDSCEISGPIGDDVTAAQVLGKKFNRATVHIFDLDWRDPSAGAIPYLSGTIADCRLEGRKWIFEIRNQFDRYNQAVGRILSPYCTADFGDAECGVERTPISATITSADDDFNFTLDIGGAYADDYFNLGSLEFASGALAGIEPVEIFSYTGATGVVQLFAPLPTAPSPGDMVVVYRGCSKLKISNNPDLPTCLSYENVLNFRGFDQVPGSDTYLKVPVPGSGGGS